MVSGYPRAEAYAAFRAAGPARCCEGPVLTAQPGRRHRRQGPGARRVVVEHARHRRAASIDCDTVVFTGDWIPDHELARTARPAMDPATRGPVVDAALRTSRAGVFAVGNLLHPVDTADGAALDGRHVATAVRRGCAPATPRSRSAPRPGSALDAPLRWVAPQLISTEGGVAARGDLLLWTDEYRRLPKLRAVQDGRDAGDQPHAVAGGAGAGLPGAVVVGGGRRPERRRRHRLLRLIARIQHSPRAESASR